MRTLLGILAGIAITITWQRTWPTLIVWALSRGDQ